MIKPKKPPYSGTKKDAESTVLDINHMLRDYGVTAYQWTTLWDLAQVELRIVLEEEGGKRTPIRLMAPAFLARRRTWNAKAGKYEKVEAPDWPQSMRLFFWYLKAKLEAIAYGLREVREEFLYDVITHDAQGREVRVGDLVAPALESGRLDLPELGEGTKKEG